MLCLCGFELYSRWVPLKRLVCYTVVFSVVTQRSSLVARSVALRYQKI